MTVQELQDQLAYQKFLKFLKEIQESKDMAEYMKKVLNRKDYPDFDYEGYLKALDEIFPEPEEIY